MPRGMRRAGSRARGYIKLVTPDGQLRQVADGELSNRRVFAEGLGPDGICLDADGAVWAGTGGFSVARVAPGGEVLHRVELPENRAPFALMLGGPDRRTLFILTAEWRLADGHVANLDRLADGPRTGQILTLPVSVPRRRPAVTTSPARPGLYAVEQ
jgi:sugar lactone lactonase YvrE